MLDKLKIHQKQRTSSTNNSIEDENFNYIIDEDEDDENEDMEAYDEPNVDSDNYNDDFDVIVMQQKAATPADTGSHRSTASSSHNHHYFRDHYAHSDHEQHSKSRDPTEATNLAKFKLNSSTDHALLASSLSSSSSGKQLQNKHDLSSNTLSVDSGLSVPTTTGSTNSEPESEKSTNFIQSAVASLTLNAASVLAQVNAHLNSTAVQHPHDFTDDSETKAQHQLKRQKRMLYLNSNSLDQDETTTFTANSTTDPHMLG